MCYFLYGAVNSGVNVNDYQKVAGAAGYCFNVGDVQDVNACVENCGDHYRINGNHCDCYTALGAGHTNKKELHELKDLLLRLKDVRGIKYVLISKNWWEETNEKQETVHINDIDILHFLANIENNCLYKIELYPKYY